MPNQVGRWSQNALQWKVKRSQLLFYIWKSHIAGISCKHITMHEGLDLQPWYQGTGNWHAQHFCTQICRKNKSQLFVLLRRVMIASHQREEGQHTTFWRWVPKKKKKEQWKYLICCCCESYTYRKEGNSFILHSTAKHFTQCRMQHDPEALHRM